MISYFRNEIAKKQDVTIIYRTFPTNSSKCNAMIRNAMLNVANQGLYTFCRYSDDLSMLNGLQKHILQTYDN